MAACQVGLRAWTNFRIILFMTTRSSLIGSHQNKKYQVIVSLKFTVEAEDVGEAMKKVEGVSIHDKIGNLNEYDYKSVIINEIKNE